MTIGTPHSVPVGTHPGAAALDTARGLLYVPSGNADSVVVVDTRARLQHLGISEEHTGPEPVQLRPEDLARAHRSIANPEQA